MTVNMFVLLFGCKLASAFLNVEFIIISALLFVAVDILESDFCINYIKHTY